MSIGSLLKQVNASWTLVLRPSRREEALADLLTSVVGPGRGVEPLVSRDVNHIQ